MAITGSYTCTIFKKHLLEAVHDFRPQGHAFKIALYGPSADLSADTLAYTTEGEITGTGYTVGGLLLTNIGPVISGRAGVASFQDAVWTAAGFSARAALIYNSSFPQGYENPAVMVLDFGQERTTNGQDFVVRFPPADSNNGILVLF